MVIDYKFGRLNNLVEELESVGYVITIDEEVGDKVILHVSRFDDLPLLIEDLTLITTMINQGYYTPLIKRHGRYYLSLELVKK